LFQESVKRSCGGAWVICRACLNLLYHSITIYQLRIVLRGVSPLVWRRLLVESDTGIAELREIREYSNKVRKAPPDLSPLTQSRRVLVREGPRWPFLREMERGENANGQKFGQVRVPSRRLNFRQDLPELQDQLI
jgi:hypothetical protein